jgi:hypothetical protein
MKKSIQKERFEKVASKRVQNIIDNINSLSKCSNTYNYEYSKEDVDIMIKEIKNTLAKAESLFRNNLKTPNSKFKF